MHNNSCKNGCKFARKFHLMSYANKNDDGTYSNADYLYTCTKLEHTVSFDSTVYKLGCATYEYEREQSQECICTKETEKPVIEPSKLPSDHPVSEPVPVVTPELSAPVPAPATVSVPPVEPVQAATPVAEPKKPRKPRTPKPLQEQVVVETTTDIPKTPNIVSQTDTDIPKVIENVPSNV